MSLPLELRLDIYRHLLLTDQPIIAQSPAYLSYHGIKPAATKKNLSPDILRVSRAVHEEASAILYEENTFQYHCQADGDGALAPFEDGHSKSFSAKMKHTDLYCHQKETRLTSECVSTLLERLNTLGCSLKTLRLTFVLKRPWRSSAARQDALSRSVLHSAFERYRILNSLQALHVQQKIEMHLTTEMEEDGRGFEFLVNAAARRLGWKAELRSCEHRPRVVLYGPGAISTLEEHKWSWVLQVGSGSK